MVEHDAAHAAALGANPRLGMLEGAVDLGVVGEFAWLLEAGVERLAAGIVARLPMAMQQIAATIGQHDHVSPVAIQRDAVEQAGLLQTADAGASETSLDAVAQVRFLHHAERADRGQGIHISAVEVVVATAALYALAGVAMRQVEVARERASRLVIGRVLGIPARATAPVAVSGSIGVAVVCAEPTECRHVRFRRPIVVTRAEVEAKVVRDDKLPIGIHALEDRYVFTYLVTRVSTADFRTFLVRHHHLWRMLNRWTLRVLVPTPLATSTQAYRHAFQEQLRQPLGLSDGKDLEWLFEQRKRAEQEPGFTLDARARQAADRYRGPRFEALEKAWRTHVANAVATVYCNRLDDQFVRGQAAVEFVPMTRQYLHLAHLVGTT